MFVFLPPFQMFISILPQRKRQRWEKKQAQRNLLSGSCSCSAGPGQIQGWGTQNLQHLLGCALAWSWIAGAAGTGTGHFDMRYGQLTATQMPAPLNKAFSHFIFKAREMENICVTSVNHLLTWEGFKMSWKMGLKFKCRSQHCGEVG